MKIKLKLDDPHTRAVWATVLQARAEVASWPAWKRGDRYFRGDNDGCTYTVVALDLEDAKDILRNAGITFIGLDASGNKNDGLPFEQATIEWREETPERAAEIRVFDDEHSESRPLNTFKPGDWFSSEY